MLVLLSAILANTAVTGGPTRFVNHVTSAWVPENTAFAASSVRTDDIVGVALFPLPKIMYVSQPGVTASYLRGGF
jgi:hypothetical protein